MVSLSLTLNTLPTFFKISFVVFKQENGCWVLLKKTALFQMSSLLSFILVYPHVLVLLLLTKQFCFLRKKNVYHEVVNFQNIYAGNIYIS